MVRLKVLRLNLNKIKKIQGLDKLTSLSELYLDGNQIEKIEGLEAQSQSLVELSILGNKISYESNLEYLGNTLKKFEKLQIHKNPLCPDHPGTRGFAKKVKT